MLARLKHIAPKCATSDAAAPLGYSVPEGCPIRVSDFFLGGRLALFGSSGVHKSFPISNTYIYSLLLIHGLIQPHLLGKSPQFKTFTQFQEGAPQAPRPVLRSDVCDSISATCAGKIAQFSAICRVMTTNPAYTNK